MELVANGPQELMPVYNYIERNNIVEYARFNAANWSVYDLTVTELLHTTNSAESWHSWLNGLVRYKHPSVLVLIDFLKQEKPQMREFVAKVNAVHWPVKRNRKQIQRESRIRSVMEQINEFESLPENVKSISSNIYKE